MLKVALIAAAVALTTTAATASNAAVDSPNTSTMPPETPCRPGPAPELGCPLHVAGIEPSATPADLASLAVPGASPVDVAPLRPATDLAFKDAATDTASVLPATIDCTRPQRVVPMLLALGALAFLLRRRPY